MGPQEWVVGALLSQGGRALRGERHWLGEQKLEKGPNTGKPAQPPTLLGSKSSDLNRPELWEAPTGQGLGDQIAGLGAWPQPCVHTVLLRSSRCLCTHCIFLSRAKFSGSTTPAKPRFSSAYS
jgi:hypothetical protein